METNTNVKESTTLNNDDATKSVCEQIPIPIRACAHVILQNCLKSVN